MREKKKQRGMAKSIAFCNVDKKRLWFNII